ncbi:hypothetical protein AWZ03_004221 [Drosophila navojoa]|uniref:Uncharacterized protein n=1 Tax=Drosophila navojoa TaxID=7232 RepID=A0A484BKP9_DRONA|nr:uncharacterized protein LOC108653046 [Drosophila navojoa]TDG49353.1 hypothetical protein AWZ03_004221 [Drosophila navojoa]
MLINFLLNNGVQRTFSLSHCIGCLSHRANPRSLRTTQSALNSRQVHGSKWRRQNAVNEQRRKIIPKLVYLHNPWKYLITKFNMWKLKWLWDYGFNESEFVEGSKQAAIVMTDIIRQQSAEKISEFTTPVGFQQITRDMLLSRNDSRLQLVRFEHEHLRRAIPMKVATRQNYGRKYAFIDMLFVGLRNTKDFDSPTELVEINDILRRMDNELKTPSEVVSVPHRIVFAEIFIRFRRDYTAEWRRKEEASRNPTDTSSSNDDGHHHAQQPASTTSQNMMIGRVLSRLNDPGWSVSFYKILTFDVLNFDPQPNRRSNA